MRYRIRQQPPLLDHRYGLKMQYPYYWSMDGNSYPAEKAGVQLASWLQPRWW